MKRFLLTLAFFVCALIPVKAANPFYVLGENTDGFLTYWNGTAGRVSNSPFQRVDATRIGLNDASHILTTSSDDLVFTNGIATSLFLQVRNNTGTAGNFGITSAGHANVLADTGKVIVLSPDNGSTSFQVLSTGFYPTALGKDLGSPSTINRWNDLYLDGEIRWNGTTNSVADMTGAGTPEGVITADIGSIYRRYDGGSATTLYVKTSGNGSNTGWQAVTAGASGTISGTLNTPFIPYASGATTLADSPLQRTGAETISLGTGGATAVSLTGNTSLTLPVLNMRNNGFLLTSAAPDNVTNRLYVLNATATQSFEQSGDTDGSVLLAVQNNGTNVFTVHPSGNIVVGGLSEPNDASIGSPGKALASWRYTVEEFGGTNIGNQILVGTFNQAGQAFHEWNMLTDTNAVTVDHIANNLYSLKLKVGAYPTPEARIQILDNGASEFWVKMLPTEADGATAVPFIFNTQNAITTAGAELLNIRNNNAKYWTLDRLGSITQGDGSQASLTYASSLSGASDPALTFQNALLAVSQPIGAADGSTGAPGISFSGDTDTGIWRRTGNEIDITLGGTTVALMQNAASQGLTLMSTLPVSWSTAPVSTAPDTFIYREGADIVQHGDDEATPDAQTIKGPDGSGTDINGANMSIGPGKSTGTGTPGIVKVEVGKTGTTGSSVNAYATAVGVGGVLHVNTTNASNTDTGEDDLLTFSVPAGQLSVNDQSLECRVYGSFAANANNKTIKIYFGATQIFSTGALAANSGDWDAVCTIIRTGATSQEATVSFRSSNSLLNSSVLVTSPAETLSGAVTFKCTGEATATADILQKGVKILWHPND